MPRPSRPAGRQNALTAVTLALLAMLPFLARGLSSAFVGIDDGSYIVENPAVRAGLSADGVRWAFRTFHVANWHPLTWLSHMLDVSLFGLDARGHHLTSVLIHGSNTALLFLALLRLTGQRWPSALAAALFGVHPLHVESVAWVAERKDVLAGFFFMLIILAWERHVRRGAGMARSLLVVVALLALGLMAKPMLVTVPFVLLLLDVWPLGRLRIPPGGTAGGPAVSRLFIEKLPLLALAALSSVLTVLAQGAGGAVVPLKNIGIELRAANAVISCGRYLGKTFWPSDLAAFYPYPAFGVSWTEAGLAFVLLAALTSAAALRARARPSLAVGWCWFLGMLVPVIGLVQVGEQAMADRYTYLPLVGIFVSFAWFATSLLGVRRIGAAIPGACLAIVAACLALSTVQAGYWRDSETLFRRALAVTEGNWLALNNLGSVLNRQGRHAEALQLFQEALRIAPNYEQAVRNSGVALLDLGRAPEATEKFRQAVRLAPEDATAHYYLGLALIRQDRPRDAETSFRDALKILPDYAEAAAYLGISLSAQGRFAEAASSFSEALRLRPDLAEASYRLGAALQSLGRDEEALREYAAALRPGLDPALASQVHLGIGMALIRLGKAAEAAGPLERALALDPGNEKAAYNLGALELLAGQNEKAFSRLSAVLVRSPGNADARGFLAVALVQLGRPAEAAREYEFLARMRPQDHEIRYNLGLAQRLAGDETRARAAFREALRLSPGFEPAAAALAGD